MSKKAKIINSVCWIIGLIVVWEIVSFILCQTLGQEAGEKRLTSFHKIIQLFMTDWQDLLVQAGVTLSRAGLGFLFGAGIGYILAILMSLSKIIEKISMPYLLIAQMIPILGLAPIVFSLVKDLNISRVVIAAYMTFFSVSVNTLSGLKSVDNDMKVLMYSYAAKKTALYAKLMIPFSLPYLFSGLKIAAPSAVTASILVDTLAIQDGIGQKIVYTLYGGGTAGVFWPAVILGALLGVFAFLLITLLEYIVIPWQRERNGGTE
ncbi:MAG: ABC transporter permease subunit [Oscillospiraceae bacterium]|nr:ABC transporter permease subunit [Oscillospiraceae bacterium]